MECGHSAGARDDGFYHAFHRHTYKELEAATKLLREVMQPDYPIVLMLNETGTKKQTAAQWKRISKSVRYEDLWDQRRFFNMDERLAPAFERWRQQLSSKVTPVARTAHEWKSTSFWKTSALLQSAFNRTVFIDSDVYVLDPSFAHSLLTQTLRVADVAIPVNTARSGYWAQTPAPLLCITLIAYHRNAPRCRPTWSARPIDWRREPMTCLV